MRRTLSMSLALVALGCSGGSQTAPSAEQPTATATPPAPAGDVYAALEVGADYQSYQKMSTEAFVSPTHGGRYVEVWVNDIGAEAYKGEGDFPVGTVIVKSSWEVEDGQKTDVAGPLFVMEKRAAGFDSEHNDWWYALHWEKVPDSWVAKMGNQPQVYWRTPSTKIDYCWGCHENYDRDVGLPAKGYRAWEAAE